MNAFLQRSILTVAPALPLGSAPGRAAAAAEPVSINDNTRGAGDVDGDVVTVHLRAGAGTWHPEGPGGPGLEIEALGEAGHALMVPAQLIRVTEGTTIVASVHNDLPTRLRANGWGPGAPRRDARRGNPRGCELDGDAEARPARVTIAVGGTCDFEFEDPPGRTTLWLDVRGTNGRWQAQGRVAVR